MILELATDRRSAHRGKSRKIRKEKKRRRIERFVVRKRPHTGGTRISRWKKRGRSEGKLGSIKKTEIGLFNRTETTKDFSTLKNGKKLLAIESKRELTGINLSFGGYQ